MVLRLRQEYAGLEVVPEFLQENWSLRRYKLRLRSGRISHRGDKGVGAHFRGLFGSACWERCQRCVGPAASGPGELPFEEEAQLFYF